MNKLFQLKTSTILYKRSERFLKDQKNLVTVKRFEPGAKQWELKALPVVLEVIFLTIKLYMCATQWPLPEMLSLNMIKQFGLYMN